MPELDAFRARISFGLSITSIALMAVFIPVRYAVSPMHPMVLAGLFISASLCMWGAYSIRKEPEGMTGRYAVLFGLFILPISAGLKAGGLEAPIMPIFVLVPLIAGFCAGRLAALIFTSLAIFASAFFYVLWITGYLPSSTLSTQESVNAARLVISAALMLLSLGVALLFDRTRVAEIKARHTLELERAKGLRQAKIASLAELSAGIAHEVNNPLAIVVGLAQALPKYASDEVKLKEKLKAIDDAAKRIASIIKSLRKFSRTDGRRDVRENTLIDLIHQSIRLTTEYAKRHAVRIDTDFQSSTTTISCDDVEIVQAIVNLVNNGIDAAKLSSDRWVRISTFETANRIVVQIQDSGNGVAPAVANKIFEPFVTTKEVGEGPGLGLAVAKGIMDEHGGTVQWKTDVPNTCFELGFPKQQSVPQA